MNKIARVSPPLGKFQDPMVTATGQERASVALVGAQTLWFNTGTLCNIECVNCYIESSPSNDRLVYMDTSDIAPFLDQIEARNWPVREIGFTGGEPFMNPAMVDMARLCLKRGFEVLILTNAMLPMMRKRVQAELCDLIDDFGDKLTLRISLDHYRPDENDKIRGEGSYACTLEGMLWLQEKVLNWPWPHALYGERPKLKTAQALPLCSRGKTLKLTHLIQAKQCCFLRWTKR